MIKRANNALAEVSQPVNECFPVAIFFFFFFFFVMCFFFAADGSNWVVAAYQTNNHPISCIFLYYDAFLLCVVRLLSWSPGV
jgi:hypothetical protein